MMEQRGLAPSASDWFLIASQGDLVVRIRPGMLLGETVAGELVFFNPSCAQLELDVAYDGSAVLSAAANYELESAGGTRSRRESLARHRRVEIRLPHNVLQLDTDFANPVEADDTVEIRIVPLKQDVPRPSPGRTQPRPAERTVDEYTVDASAIRRGFQNRRAERTGVRRQRTLNPLMAASIGLAVIGLTLLYPGVREGRQSKSPATADAVHVPQTDPVQAAGLAIEGSARETKVDLTTIRVPPLPLRLLELPASRLDPIVRRPEEYGSILPIAETTREPAGRLKTEMAMVVVENQPARAFVTELEGAGETSQAPEALVQWQTQRASDPALVQEPQSPVAGSGLQSVRQQLINRSLAQLAGGQLGDARSSLQAAADAGADPKLITDLYAEIDYRQRLTDAGIQ